MAASQAVTVTLGSATRETFDRAAVAGKGAAVGTLLAWCVDADGVARADVTGGGVNAGDHDTIR